MLFYTRGIMAARIPCPPAEYATRIRNPPREDGRVSWLLEHGHEMTKSILFRLRLSSLTLRPRLLKHQTTIPNAMAENTPTTTPMATPAFLLKPPGRDASDDGSLLVSEGDDAAGCGAGWMRKNGDFATTDRAVELFTREDMISTWYCAVGRYGAGYGSPCHKYDVVFTDEERFVLNPNTPESVWLMREMATMSGNEPTSSPVLSHVRLRLPLSVARSKGTPTKSAAQYCLEDRPSSNAIRTRSAVIEPIVVGAIWT